MIARHRRLPAALLALALALAAGACSPGPASPVASIAPTVGPVTRYSAPTHSLAIPDALGLSRTPGIGGPLGEASAFFGPSGEELFVQYFGDAGGEPALERLVSQAKDPKVGAVLASEARLRLPAGQAVRMVFQVGGVRSVIYAIAAPATSAVIVVSGIADDAPIDAIAQSFRFSAAP
jgi:hypothetical protein